MMNCGAVRDRISCGPRAWRSIFITQARTRSPTRRFSFGIMCSRGSSASRRPDSMIALPRSMRLTVPVTSSSPRDRKSLQDLLALGVADALQEHLLGGLRADAAELDRLDRLLDEVLELGVGLALLRRLGQRDLLRGQSRPRRRAPPSSAGRRCSRRCCGRSRRARRRPRCSASWSPRRAPSRARGRRCRAARSSRAPARPPAAAVLYRSSFTPLSQFRHQPRPLDVLERQRDRLPVQLPSPRAPPRRRAARPTKRRRPVASGVRIRTSALRPAKRAKSAALRSGRSRPGEDTSSRS